MRKQKKAAEAAELLAVKEPTAVVSDIAQEEDKSLMVERDSGIVCEDKDDTNKQKDPEATNVESKHKKRKANHVTSENTADEPKHKKLKGEHQISEKIVEESNIRKRKKDKKERKKFNTCYAAEKTDRSSRNDLIVGDAYDTVLKLSDSRLAAYNLKVGQVKKQAAYKKTQEERRQHVRETHNSKNNKFGGKKSNLEKTCKLKKSKQNNLCDKPNSSQHSKKKHKKNNM